MEKGTFGEHLKREREMRGVSLEEISSATRISTRFLEALENEQWDRLPGGVFNRGFIRAVARFLGLDEESLIGEYALAANDKPEVAVLTSPERAAAGRRLLPWVVVLLAVVLAGGGWFAYRRYAPRLARAWHSRSPQTSTPTPPAAASEPPAAPAIVTSAPSTSAQPPVAESQTLDLKIAAGKPTVATVIADGKTLFDGKLKAGQNLRFQAQDRFKISLGDSSAVLLELNGQTIPPLGPPDKPGSVTLTRKDLNKPPGGPD